jgi:hypothetical protein
MRIITLTVTAALEDRVVQTDKELRCQLEGAVFESMNADVVHVAISRIRDVQVPDPDDEATIVEWQQRALTELHATADSQPQRHIRLEPLARACALSPAP